MITLIIAILLIVVFVRSVMLEGEVIYRITSIYPNDYKNYVWAFGQRLRVFFLRQQIKKGTIVDETLIGYYQKLNTIHLVIIFLLCLLIVSLIIL